MKYIKKNLLFFGFCFSSLILLVYGIIRFFDMAQIMWIYPLDGVNDISSYMAMLHFLVQYGYHGFVPNWYNGFILFSVYPPGWMFAVYPLYLIFKNVQVVAYVALIIQYIFGFLIIAVFGRKRNWSWLLILTFFSFLFFNVFMVGDFIRQLSLPSLLGSLLVMALSFLLIYYIDKEIDFKWFLFFIPLFFGLLISHPPEAVLFSVLLLGFLLIKSWKDCLKIIFASILSFCFGSFWLIPFLKYSFNSSTSIVTWTFANWLFDFDKLFLTNLATFFIAIALFFSFYLFWLTKNKSKRILLFFLPLLLLCFLFVTRLVIFVPIFKYVYPEPYTHFFIFFICFFFFSLDFNRWFNNKYFKVLLFLVLVILPLFFVLLSHFNTSYFITYTNEENEILSLFPYISENDVFLVTGVENDNLIPKVVGAPSFTSWAYAYYSYGAIYMNFSTPFGWGDLYASKEYLDFVSEMGVAYDQKDCSSLNKIAEIANVTKLITYGVDDCNFLSECMSLTLRKGNACLFEINSV